MVEQLTRNEQVVSSSLAAGSTAQAAQELTTYSLWEMSVSDKKPKESGLIERIDLDSEEIKALLGWWTVIHRDIKTAEELLNIDLDWSFNLSYNAMLQACLAYMYSKGYRPRGAEVHKTAIRFVRRTLKGWESTIDQIDQIRKKRHRVTYQVAGSVSKEEAGATFSLAKHFTDDLKEVIKSETAE